VNCQSCLFSSVCSNKGRILNLSPENTSVSEYNPEQAATKPRYKRRARSHLAISPILAYRTNGKQSFPTNGILPPSLINLIADRHKSLKMPSSQSQPQSQFYNPPTHAHPLKSRMASLKGILNRFNSSTTISSSGFSKARSPEDLFPKTDPLVDGEECLRDCDSCTVRLPSKFKIDEEEALFGHIKGWSRHVICATGKTDWVRDVSDEKGSIMEAVGKHNGLHDKGVSIALYWLRHCAANPSAETNAVCLEYPRT